ncbi:MAG TPA: flagellar motor protein MotB [Symbiobacteriaceae bacterium]|nr:flagellar motor protein MotB [Symbiobacteriaceae bacterium]
MAERHSDDRSNGGGGHGGGSSGRWLVSYADFMTLMFVVFIVLYAMAKVDSGKFNALKTSLNQSMGIQPFPTGGNPMQTAPLQPGSDPESAPGAPAPADPTTTVPTPPIPAVVLPEQPSAQEEPKSGTSGTGQKTEPATTTKPVVTQPKPVVDPLAGVKDGFKATVASRAGQLDVTLQDRGVVVSVLTSVLFSEGAAELKPGANQILDQISAQLKASTESVLVEGAPDASAKDAPWDLSSRRASAVVTYLVNTHGLSPQRFSVIGYGKGAGVDGIVNVVVLRRQ